MSRREEFEGGQVPPLYHGTRRDFPYVPDMVLPASAVGHANWEDYYNEHDEHWRRDRVFATPSENSAWSWGSMMANRQGNGRPRVHEVELSDPVNRDRELNLPAGGAATSLGTEYHGKHGRIKNTHWAPPPKGAGDWIQPSLPPMNWEPHGGRHWTSREMAGIERDIEDERRPKAPARPTYIQQGRLF